MADEIKTYELRKNPKKRIRIDGGEYSVQLGNPTFVLLAAEWQEQLQAIATGPDDVAGLRKLASDGKRLVASVVGAEGAEKLMGGDNALNLIRLIDLVGILAEVISSPESMEAVREVAASVATLDE
ncbi:hypothetical protein HF320_04995 [Collinsella sp. KGMB02528]|uniref:Uncharacterized protein n=1 Tax=Collinsella acetigenes TaxID=2713419 RepID=A0A7X9YIZ8_9ACTN|nr:hypothetical protein [Collinsella acetigenes]NMF55683.1 hypothetical protein [Collinsella acetigenes]